MTFEKKDPNSIYHYGILGMRWGFRKGPNGKVRVGRVAKGPNSKDHDRKVELKKKSVSEMTNDELKELTTRMQLERQYSELNRANVTKGQKIVADLLGNLGKQMAQQAVNKASAKAVEMAFKKTGS